jgi:hypothetical protein
MAVKTRLVVYLALFMAMAGFGITVPILPFFCGWIYEFGLTLPFWSAAVLTAGFGLLAVGWTPRAKEVGASTSNSSTEIDTEGKGF